MAFELTQLTTVLGIGFLLGIEHALDADHVVAVSTIVSKHKSIIKSSFLGVFWGIGHTITLFIVGLLVLGLKLNLPQTIALFFEFLVGIALVLLGANVLSEARKLHLKLDEHSHKGEKHRHLHYHKEKKELPHTHKSLLIGMLHGLAGSAALMLLVLTTLDSFIDGIIYILVFGISSIIGMLIISGIIGLPFKATANLDNLNHKIRFLAGAVSILLGLAIMYEIGFIKGLIPLLIELM